MAANVSGGGARPARKSAQRARNLFVNLNSDSENGESSGPDDSGMDDLEEGDLDRELPGSESSETESDSDTSDVDQTQPAASTTEQWVSC